MWVNYTEFNQNQTNNLGVEIDSKYMSRSK